MRGWLIKYGVGVVGSYLGYPVGKAMRFLNHSEHWTRSEIQKHQNQALHTLMEHCYFHVPYYKYLMQERSLRPDDFQTVDDLAKLPYLSREIIRDQQIRLRADNYPDRVCTFRRSGGTTGEPIEVAVDNRARAFEMAAYLRGLQWMKYQLGQPMVSLFGGSLGLSTKRNLKASIREWLLNIRFLPAFELTPNNIEVYVAAICKAKGGVLGGYTSAILNLVEYMSRRGLHGSQLEGIHCTAEYMPDDWRQRISQVLGAPVFCYYGCGEVNSLGYECVGETGYIIPQEHVILEVGGTDSTKFIDQGRGEACITTLYNYAMPLIRYLNGDILALQYPQQGHAHLRISKLEGRVVDQLVRHDGSMVSGALVPHMILKSKFPAWKYQVIQTELNRIVFHYVLKENEDLSSEMQQMLITLFKKHLGEALQVEFVVGQFETSKSGKHRFVVNKMD